MRTLKFRMCGAESNGMCEAVFHVFFPYSHQENMAMEKMDFGQAHG